MISASPLAICCSPSATARRPLPHNWLRPKAVFSCGMPAFIAACRAGFWPSPACRICPRMTSSTSPGSSLADARARLDRGRAEFVSRRIGEGAVERADRGALGAGDDDFRCRHGVLRKSKLATTVAVALGSALTSTRSPRSRHWFLDRGRAARSKPGDQFARFPRLPTAALQCNKSIPPARKTAYRADFRPGVSRRDFDASCRIQRRRSPSRNMQIGVSTIRRPAPM